VTSNAPPAPNQPHRSAAARDRGRATALLSGGGCPGLGLWGPDEAEPGKFSQLGWGGRSGYGEAKLWGNAVTGGGTGGAGRGGAGMTGMRGYCDPWQSETAQPGRGRDDPGRSGGAGAARVAERRGSTVGANGCCETGSWRGRGAGAGLDRPFVSDNNAPNAGRPGWWARPDGGD
jgi:hypothetical protein